MIKKGTLNRVITNLNNEDDRGKMATITIKTDYIKILGALGSVNAIVEDAIRKYLVDKCVERFEKSKRKIEEFEKRYDCNYAEFISKISNDEGLKAVERISLNWEGDMTEWEYWGNELKEWKARLELLKSS
ncbi:MAG: hypothetical protein WBD09_05615 [Halobacteriota archaeon]